MKGNVTVSKSTRVARAMSWLVAIEPFSKTGLFYSADPDALRLKNALKQAVERDLAPKSLIDSIKNGIRTDDESR